MKESGTCLTGSGGSVNDAGYACPICGKMINRVELSQEHFWACPRAHYKRTKHLGFIADNVDVQQGKARD